MNVDVMNRQAFDSTKLELRGGVTLSRAGQDWTIHVDGQSVKFQVPLGSAADLLRSLQDGGCSLSYVASLPTEMGATTSAANEVEKLWRYGWIIQTLYSDTRRLACFVNFGEAPLIPALVALDRPVVFNENVFWRRTGEMLTIESAVTGAALQLSDKRLFNLPALLLASMTVGEIAYQLDLPDYLVAMLIGWLSTLSNDAPEVSTAATTWSFSDRLMHARSRRGRHIGGYGATFPLRDKLPEPPALRNPISDRVVSLLIPEQKSPNRSLDCVKRLLEERHSVREHCAVPITIEELSGFLYYTARVIRRQKGHLYEIAERPYPSGGALHELEVYPLVNRCSGLHSGLFRYNGAQHSLESITEPTADTQRLLSEAKQSCLMHTDPHVLILIAARFLRVNWKYESISYALTLKHVGVLYQTMYLVATAMGLGACALGGGNAHSFGRATHLDYWEESVVGEFMLGRPT